METTNCISTRLRNLMNAHVGKTYKFYAYGEIWLETIKGIMDDGYFLTEINDGRRVWQSNASYSEIRIGLKKGYYAE